jgi:hypothetical protein
MYKYKIIAKLIAVLGKCPPIAHLLKVCHPSCGAIGRG